MTAATDVFVPGDQQAAALAAIQRWYFDEHSPQVFHLFGYAGTGKTELASRVATELGLRNVCAAAYTGKAAHVMRSRGIEASTIHSLIYQPLGRDTAALDALRVQLADLPGEGLDPEEFFARRDDLTAAIAAEERKPKTLMFGLRADSELFDAQLLILDEVSMVNEEMAQDLLGFGVKTLVLGDPEQLPPVGGAGYFTEVTPEYLLTEPHRFALDSPIIRIATSIRQSRPGDAALGVSGSDGNCGRFRGVRNILAYQQVICGTNKLRWQLINHIRGLEGRYGPKPVPGDRIVILANSRDAGVFNGQIFTVLTCEVDKGSNDKNQKYMLTVCDDSSEERQLRAWADGFVNFNGEKDVAFSGRGLTVAATFAQAITCHKSQGSGWPNVLVVDEASVFSWMETKKLAGKVSGARLAEAGHIAARRWLYTAVTRAAQRVSIVSSQSVLPR
jgi:exodeoxyribonuclease V